MRFSLTTLYGSNFEGGHFSRDGTTASGASTPVPLYRHEVSLDYARVELELQYALTEQWSLALRVPWERKNQDAAITVVDPADAEQRASMQRNADLHHRDATFSGAGDLMLLGRRRWNNVRLAAGFTIPTGHTVENPYLLGDRGVEHVHIQFGTGTFDPLLEAGYRRPLRGNFSGSVFFAARLPLYENSRSFKAPAEASVALGVSHRTTGRLSTRLELGGYAQGYGHWDGLRDENTGLLGTSIAAGTTVHLRSLSLSADIRYPLSQRTLDEGDAFQQGPTFAVSVGGPLRGSAR